MDEARLCRWVQLRHSADVLLLWTNQTVHLHDWALSTICLLLLLLLLPVRTGPVYACFTAV
jgi:hypothetical protein